MAKFCIRIRDLNGLIHWNQPAGFLESHDQGGELRNGDFQLNFAYLVHISGRNRNSAAV